MPSVNQREILASMAVGLLWTKNMATTDLRYCINQQWSLLTAASARCSYRICPYWKICSLRAETFEFYIDRFARPKVDSRFTIKFPDKFEF